MFFLIGVMVAFGAVALTLRDEARTKGMAVLWTSILSGAIGARIGYVLTHLPHYRANMVESLYIWDGGFNPFVGVAATLIVATWLSIGRDIRWTRVIASLVIGMSTWGMLHIAGSWRTENAPMLIDVMLQNLDGTATPLSSYLGKPVVLNLWATWCPPCRREMPVLAAAQTDNKDVNFVFVNQNESTNEVRGFLKAQALSIDNVLLDQGLLATEYNAPGLPTTFFFDRNGRLKHVHMGQLSTPKLADYLRSITEVEID